MATRSFIADDETTVGAGLDPVAAGAAGILRYQLNVVAPSMVDVVASAGGWLCDRARAGWDVNVVVADDQDSRPLAFLGATPLGSNTDCSSILKKAARGGALAVSAELLGTDDRIRADVLKILKRGFTEVTFWGDQWPAELGRRVEPVQRAMSSAARAFKAHALGAAAVSRTPVAATETLFYLGADSFRPLYSV